MMTDAERLKLIKESVNGYGGHDTISVSVANINGLIRLAERAPAYRETIKTLRSVNDALRNENRKLRRIAREVNGY